MLCEVCQAEETAFTVIPIGEGMPMSLGVACLGRWVLGEIKDVLPAEEIANILGPMFVAPARQEALAKVETPAPKKSKAAKATARPEPDAKDDSAEPGTDAAVN